MSAGEYNTAARRWQGVGPYYAMFPTNFADDVVARYTNPGDVVLDPFAGRGTAIFSAAQQGRKALGVEINPVGWLYGKTKLRPAGKAAVASRFREVGAIATEYSSHAAGLPVFFQLCFSKNVLAFLLAARESLDWYNDSVDRTTMALLLVYLHGKRGAALSNQMRQTKSMAPDYSVRWWRERNLLPPEIDPLEFMISRLEWRYAKGTPKVGDSEIFLGDSEEQVSRMHSNFLERWGGVKLLFTSPPYYALTNYHYDQWLRLWLMGGPPTARRVTGSHDLRAKFENAARYRLLLQNVFSSASPLLRHGSVVYVRTGVGRVTLDATLQSLKEAFPAHHLNTTLQPYSRPTQTSLFGDARVKAGEVDIVMTSA